MGGCAPRCTRWNRWSRRLRPRIFRCSWSVRVALVKPCLHRECTASRPCDKQLVNVICAAMNPAQLSAELGLSAIGNGNGHGSGEIAGTVVFDEISELDSICQRNLLYALPDGDGNPRQGTLGARVISTTSRNLDEEMRAGRFRAELYYRVNGVCLRLPPLRDRREDIPILVEFFLSKHAAQLRRPRPSLSPRTLRVLLDHSWPGNIRELENVVKKIVALGDEQLAVAELTAVPAPPSWKSAKVEVIRLKLLLGRRRVKRNAD